MMNKEDMENEVWRQRNRQVGRLLHDLKGFNMPSIITDGIKKYFDYFATDVIDMVNKENTNGKQEINGNC